LFWLCFGFVLALFWLCFGFVLAFFRFVFDFYVASEIALLISLAALTDLSKVIFSPNQFTPFNHDSSI
jgi:hypothetical protein